MHKTLSLKRIDKRKINYGNFFAHIFLIVGGLVLLYPLVFMFLAGLFTAEEYSSTIIGLFPFPEEVTFENYLILVKGTANSHIQKYFTNSIIRTSYSVVCAIFTSFLGGYVFSRLNFKNRDKIFLFLLATQMIPGVVALIPTYIQYARWPFAGGNDIFFGGKGILDSWWVYLITGPSINIMGTFIMKQFMESIPKELDEAAKVDGAGTARLLFKILFPLCKPIMAYIAITTSIGVWNDWATPFFFTSSDELQTAPAAITRLSSVADSTFSIPNYPLMITLGIGMTLPAMILYFIFQKQLVQGLANTGIKG